MRSRLLFAFTLLCLSSPLYAEKLQKWIYIQTNLLPDQTATQVEELIIRAGKAGYDHALIADAKFSRLAEMPEKYFKHVTSLRETAASAGIEVVPAVFSMGYSNDLLGRDPNLAEGLPVKEALFIVKGGEASAVTEAPTALLNGDFSSSDKRNGWKLLDDGVKIVDGVLHMGGTQGGKVRAAQSLKLHPFRCYHLRLRLRSESFVGMPEVKILTADRQLNYAYLNAKKTQDWTEHHVVFNSLDHSEASLYLGAWDAAGGELWWDDVQLEESGLVNLLRRDGCPFTVKTEEGQILSEGTDYEPVSDPRTGMQPWAGNYDIWHQPPVIRTRLPDDTKLRVSFFHPVTIYTQQVCACPSEPKTLELLRDQAKRMATAWQPRGFMMSHDEWRVMNWCDACQKRQLDAGTMVAQNVKECIRTLHAVNPGGAIHVWSDMFDPHHNAKKNYYLVRGDLTGSWEGLEKEVILMNWNLGKLRESLPFFAARGHRQVIAGYYDSDVEHLRNHLAAAKSVPGIIGVMYTTWKQNYRDLEAFAKIADSFTP